jgi:hypothetical protein
MRLCFYDSAIQGVPIENNTLEIQTCFMMPIAFNRSAIWATEVG